MIIITIEMYVPADKTKELLQTLLAVTERIRMETGCIGCDLLKDVSDENKYRLVGKWEQEDDVNKHLHSEQVSVVLGAMSLLEKQPEIRLDVVSCTKGMELLHKARGEQKSITMRK